MKRLVFSIILTLMLVIPAFVYGQNVNVDSNADVTAVFEGSEGKRNVPHANLPSFPQGPSYFSEVPMTHEFLGMVDLAKINNTWTRHQLNMWSRTDIDGTDKIRVEKRLAHPYHDRDKDRLKIVFANPQQRELWEFIGTIVISAEDSVSTETLFAALGINTLESGANIIYPINEGAQRVLSVSSWGLSLGYTHVKIGGGSESSAGAGTAGVGWSTGSSKYHHEPFIRVAIYRVDEDTFRQIPTFPERNNNVELQNQALQNEVRQLREIVEQYQQSME